MQSSAATWRQPLDEEDVGEEDHEDDLIFAVSLQDIEKLKDLPLGGVTFVFCSGAFV